MEDKIQGQLKKETKQEPNPESTKPHDKVVNEYNEQYLDKLTQMVESMQKQIIELSNKVSQPKIIEPFLSHSQPHSKSQFYDIHSKSNKFAIYSDTLNDLILYMLVGLVILLIIDYFYKLGTKLY